MKSEATNLSDGLMGAAPPTRLVNRIASLDAYRGLVMFLMMAEVLELSRVARAMPDSAFWPFLAHHQTHVEWVGCSLHDLIQPSFSFLVGVALPFSLASRAARGQSRVRMTLHAFWRALVLILLGVFLRSIGRARPTGPSRTRSPRSGWAMSCCSCSALRPVREQWAALGLILVGYWAAFALYPLPGPDFDCSKVGVSTDWPHMTDRLCGALEQEQQSRVGRSTRGS